MARSNKVRKREPANVIGELLGAPRPPEPKAAKSVAVWSVRCLPPPVRRRRRPVWRHLRSALVVVPLAALAAPVLFWFHYRGVHVTTKNAAVRGHLTEIGTRTSGLVREVAVDDGDRVKAGQVLVQLEDGHLRAVLREARAEVEGLERTIEVERTSILMSRLQNRGQGPQGHARIAAARARVEAARIEADDARRTHELQVIMHSKDLVTTQGLRDAEFRRRAAEARLEEAEANAVVVAQSVEQEARRAGNDVTLRERRLAVLEAELLAARARVTRTEADLESAAIRAPQDGAVVRRIAQPGRAVDTGEPVISMWLGEDLWVEAWIEEQDLEFVRKGGKATVTFPSLSGREWSGRVERIGVSTDLEIPESEVPQPRFARMDGAPVVSVRIRLDQLPPELVPGLSAVVAIERAD